MEAFEQCLKNNIDGLGYHKKAIKGSGVIEKAVDIVVARRMKRRGMSWSREGANNILSLRTNSLNNEWELRYKPVSYHTILDATRATEASILFEQILAMTEIVLFRRPLPIAKHNVSG